MRERVCVSKKFAEKYGAVFVPLCDDFTVLAKRDGAKYWTLDCIHPMLAGHEHIARKWMESCKDIIKQEKRNV